VPAATCGSPGTTTSRRSLCCGAFPSAETFTMKRLPLILCATLLGAFMAKDALALDFKSVGASPPSCTMRRPKRPPRPAVAPRGMPVEVVLAYGDWSKVATPPARCPGPPPRPDAQAHAGGVGGQCAHFQCRR
jgi:hypothetical protein